MGRLSLVWDAPWLIWTAGQAHEVNRREISNPDMVVEVLRALRHQVGIGAEVIHAEWAKPATVVPSAVLPNDVTAAQLARSIKCITAPSGPMHACTVTCWMPSRTGLGWPWRAIRSGPRLSTACSPKPSTVLWFTPSFTTPFNGTARRPAMAGRFGWTSENRVRSRCHGRRIAAVGASLGRRLHGGGCVVRHGECRPPEGTWNLQQCRVRWSGRRSTDPRVVSIHGGQSRRSRF